MLKKSAQKQASAQIAAAQAAAAIPSMAAPRAVWLCVSVCLCVCVSVCLCVCVSVCVHVLCVCVTHSVCSQLDLTFDGVCTYDACMCYLCVRECTLAALVTVSAQQVRGNPLECSDGAATAQPWPHNLAGASTYMHMHACMNACMHAWKHTHKRVHACLQCLTCCRLATSCLHTCARTSYILKYMHACTNTQIHIVHACAYAHRTRHFPSRSMMCHI